MKKILTLALLLLALLPGVAFAQDEPLEYEIEGAGTGVQGTYLVKVYTYGKKAKITPQELGRCAVHGVLFRGFANKELRQHQKPLAGSALAEQQHADFFAAFFADGGGYANYVQMVESSRSVVKVGKKYKVGMTVTVAKEQLLKDLQAAGVVKSLTSGF